MNTQKYFDYRNNHPIDLAKDGCNIDNWENMFGKASFARHPKGFPVFSPPHKLEKCNEYSDCDPYTVEENLEGSFHQRRIECTLQMIREANATTHKEPRVLDLGCGQGHITNEIQRAFPDAEISGIDYSISAIEYAADHFPGIDFAVGDAYEPPYAKNYFDIIVCNNLWEHVPDPIFLLDRITKILKNGGFIVISTPSRYRLENLIRVIRGKPVAFMSNHHVTEYSVGQVIEQLKYRDYQVKNIYSKPIEMWSLKTKVAKAVFSLLVSMVGSHHQLESTIFFLAQKSGNATKS
ncbi:class I SAM-dependent methyltransferase [Thiolapillus sp.]